MATDAATIQDQADEFRRNLDATGLAITDPSGAVLGEAGAAAAATGAKVDGVAPAIERGAVDRIAALPAAASGASAGAGGAGAGGAGAGGAPRLAEIHIERLVQGEEALGALVVSRAIDDAAAAEIAKLLGDRPVVIRAGGRAIASAKLDAAVAAAIATAPAGARDVAAGGTRWRLGVAPWPGGDAVGLEVVVAADLDAALAPEARLQRLLLVVGGVALAIALVLALVLGAALSRPVERLVGFTEAIAAGKLDARAEVRGVRELRALAGAMNKMAGELEAGRRTLADKQRLEGELAIATQIQTSILPREFAVAGLEIAARMEPASEVGGDYYDVLAVPGGAWFGIGDVAGHGLDAGLYALMAQTAIAAAVDARPDGAPRELVAAVNRILYANGWGRLGEPRHMTLSLVRYFDDGRVVFAGAHLDLVIVRAGGAVETVATPGTWVGLVDDVAAVTVDGELRLGDGDTLVLYSDGVVEAADAAGVQLGLDRLAAAARAAAGQGPAAVVAGIHAAAAAHRARQEDDVTVVALRYRRGSST